jgi:hypothetical protein
MKHIISIGINNTDGLQPLAAAVSGAKDFANWGQSQGYSITLFTDEGGGIVNEYQIFAEIKRIIDTKTCEKLIVFFSGHGILKGPSQEVWLLSDARNNPNASINLTGSIYNASTSGIPYVVFISDACRVLPNELEFTGIGSLIFPISNDTGQDCYIDLLYATRPGSPALEVASTKGAKRVGLFTETIVEVLNGRYPELIKEQTGNSLNSYYDLQKLVEDPSYKKMDSGRWFINTINSEQSIKSIVADKARKIKITLSQNPEIKLQHQNPKPNLSEFDDEKAKNILLFAQNTIKGKTSTDKIILDGVHENLKNGLHTYDVENNSFKSILNSLDSIPTNINMYNLKSNLVKKAEIIFDAKGKQSFETQTGFTVIGATIKEVLMNCDFEILDQHNKLHIRVFNNNDTYSALIILKNGQSIPVAVLQGYVGTLVFEKNSLLTINYTPSENSHKYYDFKKYESNINFVRAFVAGAANEGFNYSKVFQNDFGKDGNINYSNAGSYLRQGKSLDPSLGLYAVYAYIQEGRTKEIKSVYNSMRNEPDNIIFDVSMLADMISYDYNKTASFCPMISLGWAYLQKFQDFVPPLVLEASKSLVPNLWTTFDKRGTEIIKELFNEKRIK